MGTCALFSPQANITLGALRRSPKAAATGDRAAFRGCGAHPPPRHIRSATPHASLPLESPDTGSGPRAVGEGWGS